MAQSQLNSPYHGTMQTPIGQQYGPYQGIPQVTFQGKQSQTQPIQQLYHHPGARQQGHLYIDYPNPSYPHTQVPYH